jgi:MFS family permease
MAGWYRAMEAKTRRVFWTCSFGWAMDTADGLVFQYMIPVLVAGLGITLAQASMITSANYIAAAVGGWIGGWLCDRYGRARILQFTIAWFSFFSFVSGFAHNFNELLAARLLQGIGFGAEWAVGAVLLGEMLNPRDRGKVLGVVHSGAAIGSGIAALMAGPVASAFPPEYGWRIVFWAGALPAILIFFIRRGSDDSEVFKAARRQSLAVGRKVNLGTIFTPKLLPITFFAALLAVGGQGAGFAVSNYLTTFLHNERGLSTSVAGYCVLFNSAGGFFGFITNAYLSDRLGRRTIFRLFGLGFILTSSLYLFGPWGAHPARADLRLLPVRHLCLVRPLFHRIVPDRSARHRPGLLLQFRPRHERAVFHRRRHALGAHGAECGDGDDGDRRDRAGGDRDDVPARDGGARAQGARRSGREDRAGGSAGGRMIYVLRPAAPTESMRCAQWCKPAYRQTMLSRAARAVSPYGQRG